VRFGFVMSSQVIAIGGGGFGRGVLDLRMEQYLLDQVAAERPRIAFLPQASAESAMYVANFFDGFTRLGAEPSRVSLFGVVRPGWKEQLLSQDIIYVGGGNTKSMLALWKDWGLDDVLREAYAKGILLCGVSAGAICWFEEGVTDSVWPLGVLPCLGILPGSCCPHFDSEAERRPSYIAMVKEKRISPGIAFDDLCMGHFKDGELHRVIAANETAQAYRLSDAGAVLVDDVERIQLPLPKIDT